MLPRVVGPYGPARGVALPVVEAAPLPRTMAGPAYPRENGAPDAFDFVTVKHFSPVLAFAVPASTPTFADA